jgi:hypothetical protein
MSARRILALCLFIGLFQCDSSDAEESLDRPFWYRWDGCGVKLSIDPDRPPGRIVEEHFELLKEMPAFETLAVHDVYFEETGLRELASLSSLRMLIISGTNLTDDGVELIAECQQIEHLWVVDCRISASSLDSIRNMQGLQSLYMLECPFISEESIERFRIDSPDVFVEYREVPSATAEVASDPGHGELP